VKNYNDVQEGDQIECYFARGSGPHALELRYARINGSKRPDL